MKAKFITLFFSSLCIFSFTNVTHADGFYSPYDDSYHESPELPPHNKTQYKFENKNFSFSVKLPNNNVNNEVYFPKHHWRDRQPVWISMRPGYPVPPNAVVGGFEMNRPLYVCHGSYNGGVHPGKLVAGKCNIGWGGNEIRLSQYQVLLNRPSFQWAPANDGYSPENAVVGGFENGRPLFICQAEYNGAVHPGKLVGQSCNIGWGGKEVLTSEYNVLVR